MLPAGEFEKDAHSLHPSDAAAAEYFPVAQDAHAAEPVAFLKLPMAHAVHGPPSAPVYPALQTQSLRAVLPAGEPLFAGQAAHGSTAQTLVA